ncbi:MAG: hypothetical protein LBU70_11105 [Chitinispirillales bacterium]|jgi:uncharacterized protein (TIGR02145 family)|nr:hypothetical protein [Chitinispirillales bacterium]
MGKALFGSLLGTKGRVLFCALVVAALAITIAGCSDKTVTGPGDNTSTTSTETDVEPREKSVGKTEDGHNVLVFEEGKLDEFLFRIDTISATDTSFHGKLLFRNLADEATPRVGDILAAEQAQLAEFGFLYKVLNVSENGDITTVEVRDASLDEAIQNAKFESETELDFDEDGNLMRMRQKTTNNNGISLIRMLAFPYGEVNASVAYTMKFNFDIDIKEWELQSIKLSLSQDADITLNANLGGQISGINTTQLASINLPPIKFLIGPVPVIVTNAIVLDLMVRGDALTNMTAAYTLKGSGEYGVEYKNGDIHKINTNNFNQSFDFSQDVSDRIRVGTIVGMQTKFYGAVGLVLSAGPALELAANGSPIGVHVIDNGFGSDYVGYRSIWNAATSGTELNAALINSAISSSGAVSADNFNRRIANEVRLDYGLQFSAQIMIGILGRSLYSYTFIETFTPIALLYRTSLLPLFADPEIILHDEGIEVKSRIERDLLNYSVNDFGICIEKAGSNECRSGGGRRWTPENGRIRSGESREFTTTLFTNLEPDDYNIRPFFRTGVGGTFYDKATPYTLLPSHSLTVNRNPAVGGTVTGSGSFVEGTDATITAVANPGYKFTGWAGAGVAEPSLETTTVSVSEERTVTANFKEFFVDPRDGQSYLMARIGNQTWMAENLNYAAAGSWCYDDDPANCDLYGRLYDWATVMGLPSSCNDIECANQIQSPHQGICPPGWHVPTDAEWTALVNFAGGWEVAGTRLRSLTDWYPLVDTFIPGTDVHGFSALPGGRRYIDGNFWNVGTGGLWWSATEDGATSARNRDVYSGHSNVYWNNWIKRNGLSLRCVKN